MYITYRVTRQLYPVASQNRPKCSPTQIFSNFVLQKSGPKFFGLLASFLKNLNSPPNMAKKSPNLVTLMAGALCF
jgi:hypothetical protein